MIDRTKRHFCLRMDWVYMAACIMVVTFFADLLINSTLTLISVVGVAVTLLPPLAVVCTIGILSREGLVKHHVRKISYTCPKCSCRGQPLFRCPKCSELLHDLRPSVYGVFHAACATCGNGLPTTDRGGRLTLDKVCSGCSADLLHSDLGKQSEYRIGIVGATSSGKTNVLITSIRSLRQDFAPENGLEVRFGDPTEERVFRQYVEWLDKGMVMQKTIPIPIPRAFNLSLRSEDGQGCLLYLYDAAGEDFQEEERLENHPIEKYDGILFVIDPFAEEGVREGLAGDLEVAAVQRTNPAPLDASEILGRLVNVLERVLKVPVGGVFPIPLAVVVTKIDACGLAEQLKIRTRPFGGSYFSLTAAAYDAESHSARVRRFLLKVGLGNVIRIVESRFARVGFFGVSSLGRSADPADRRAFKALGMPAPLVWLTFHTGALDESDEWDRSFVNLHISLLRSLKGLEGASSKQKAWIFIVCALVLWLIRTMRVFFLKEWTCFPPMELRNQAPGEEESCPPVYCTTVSASLATAMSARNSSPARLFFASSSRGRGCVALPVARKRSGLKAASLVPSVDCPSASSRL